MAKSGFDVARKLSRTVTCECDHSHVQFDTNKCGQVFARSHALNDQACYNSMLQILQDNIFAKGIQ